LDKGGINGFISEKLSDESIYTDVNKLMEVGKAIRDKIMDTPFQKDFEEELLSQWKRVGGGSDTFIFAVRSSATAEDLLDASFAGQQETYLNVMGYEDLKQKVLLVFASLFTDRAILYRHDRGFEHSKVQLCATCQKMVRSETGSAGVMFSLDTESGFRDVVFVTSAYGLWETVVGGTVNPDEWYVFKLTLAAGKEAINAHWPSALVKAHGPSALVQSALAFRLCCKKTLAFRLCRKNTLAFSLCRKRTLAFSLCASAWAFSLCAKCIGLPPLSQKHIGLQPLS